MLKSPKATTNMHYINFCGLVMKCMEFKLKLRGAFPCDPKQDESIHSIFFRFLVKVGITIEFGRVISEKASDGQ